MKAILALLLLIAGLTSGRAGIDLNSPSISSIEIEGTNILIKVQIPAGIQRVTLEGRPRFDQGAWAPRAVVRPENPALAGTVLIKLGISENVELLRVKAEDSEPLPASWYKGSNSFSGLAAGSGTVPPPAVGLTDKAAPGLAAGDSSGNRSVVESDIWQVADEKVFFFNQYRGLQVINVAQPDQPVLEGTLSMAMAGEQMYTLGNGRVVLLARDNCQGYSVESQSLVIVAGVQGGVHIEAAVPVDGTFVESRMVGSVIYVATQRYRILNGLASTDPGAVWEWGTELVSLDLADPTKPERRSKLWVPGWQTVIHATDRMMLLSNQDPKVGYRSVVQVVDISNPDGTMTLLSQITPWGNIADKFKMSVQGETVSLVSERWDNTSTPAQANGRWISKVENYSLADPKKPVRLGELNLGLGERLFATRFDGNKLYAVTFLRIDPLWVVDLSDPAKPVIFGELEIPGWSSYIHPMGDRLLSVGVETNRVAVSLFDVKNPAKPGLLSRVRLGENYSWSEANQDEKALSVFEEEGLVMLPYQGQTTNGYASRVQLIDLKRDSIAGRGFIEQTFQPRRTTLRDGRVLSISGESLLVVDASNRDLPVVKARLELAWSADRIYKQDKRILSIDNGGWSPGSLGPRVRVSLAVQPDQSVEDFRLSAEAGNVLGAGLKEGKLYVLQGRSTEVSWEPNAKGEYFPVSTNLAALTLSVVNATPGEKLSLIGQARQTFLEDTYWSQLQPAWLANGTLVWTDDSQYYGFWRGVEDGISLTPAIGKSAIRGLPFYMGGSGKVIAFGFESTGTPRYLSNVKVTGSGFWWNFSKPLISGNKVYLSHQASEFLPGVLPPSQEPPKPEIIKDPTTGELSTNKPPFGTWVQRYFLDVADFGDPVSPTMRKPVNIPGMLRGISHQGEVIYTVAPHWNPATFQTDWREWVDASAYDGVSASLIDSIQLPELWPHDVTVIQGRVLIATPAEKDRPATLSLWKLGTGGKFETRAKAEMSLGSGTLTGGEDWILSSVDGNKIEVFQIGLDDSLKRIATGAPSTCGWLDFSKITGSPAEGFWVPLGIYGISTLTLKP